MPLKKIASDAWKHATEDVIETCDEVERSLREKFKHQQFVPYDPYEIPKKSKKTITKTKSISVKRKHNNIIKRKKTTTKKKQTKEPAYPSSTTVFPPDL